MWRRMALGIIFFPRDFDEDAKDLVYGLLNTNPWERLGSLVDGSGDVKGHRFFAGRVDFQKLAAQGRTYQCD